MSKAVPQLATTADHQHTATDTRVSQRPFMSATQQGQVDSNGMKHMVVLSETMRMRVRHNYAWLDSLPSARMAAAGFSTETVSLGSPGLTSTPGKTAAKQKRNRQWCNFMQHSAGLVL
jgi:hypothetical protein